jgi:Ca2+/Na+ antiporter
MNYALIGGIVGGILGLTGGLVGTYFSIKNTSGPREKAFMIKTSIFMWIFGITFLLLFFILPMPWRFLLWIPYSIILPLFIILGNRAQQRIKQEESQQKEQKEPLND